MASKEEPDLQGAHDHEGDQVEVTPAGKPNKFSHLFNEDMSSIEARYVLYANVDGLSEEDRKELNEAYAPVCDAITDREIQGAFNGWIH